MKPKVSILYAPGTNCEVETMKAVELADGNPRLVFLNQLIAGKERITDCDLLIVPGGFSYGDYIDTGIVVATLAQEFFQQLVEAKIPVLGICNGFQILVRAGLFGDQVTLTTNDSGVFCSRPISHRVKKSNCLWTKGLEGQILEFPCAHQGGKVSWTNKPNIIMTYVGYSPNGGEIAAICSDNGLIFGLMDHPERPYGNSDGLKIFRNGIQAVQ